MMMIKNSFKNTCHVVKNFLEKKGLLPEKKGSLNKHTAETGAPGAPWDDFHKTSLRSFLVPRMDIVALPQKSFFMDVAHQFLTHRLPHLPVFCQTIDNITGVLAWEDVLSLSLETQDHRHQKWQHKITPALFAPPSMLLVEALRMLQEKNQTFILVVDEYGGIEGSVFASRIVQEITRLLSPYEPLLQTYQRIADGAYVVDGRLRLDQLPGSVPCFDGDLFKKNAAHTIGGLIGEQLGRLPFAGEVVLHHPSGISFEVLVMRPQYVQRVAMHLPNFSKDVPLAPSLLAPAPPIPAPSSSVPPPLQMPPQDP